MFRYFFLLVLMIYSSVSNGQSVDFEYYFSDDHSFDSNIPTPASYFGFEIGEWHISHDKIDGYIRLLAEKSDRVSIQTYGNSHEGRPLSALIISTADNQKRLELKRKQHLAWCDPTNLDISYDDVPVVLYQGFSIHGNEASGANAAMLYAYYLTACTDKALIDILDGSIILLDPAYNPDGINRFASWVNVHKNTGRLTPDNSDREYSESWPGGRTNHYWFDLNRDWLPVQQPESKGRVALFHKWKPNILTDHHEMGTNNTYFFQPGIPSRTNPETPARNQELTGEIAKFHAKALDKIGSLYYSKESFDDFYYGKGSTYPDVNGCIGILFEQASSRGHVQNSANGILTFPFTIRNQLTTSISTLKAGHELRKDLLSFQRSFFADGRSEAKKDVMKGYVVGDDDDPFRLNEFLKILDIHEINYEFLDGDLKDNDQVFHSDRSIYIEMDQPQYKVIKAIFQKETVFKDSLFYDVSSWTLPLAFDLPYKAMKSRPAVADASEKARVDNVKSINLTDDAYAYVIPWSFYNSPAVVYELQHSGLRAKVSAASFTATVGEEQVAFPHGTVIIPTQGQRVPVKLLTELSKKYGVPVYGISTGLTMEGVNLGSPQIRAMDKPKVALVVGNGVSAYDAGEIWHLLDYRYEIPVTKLAGRQINRRSLSRFNTLILPHGSYPDISKSMVEEIKQWVSDGGTLILQRGAVSWAIANGLSTAKKINKSSNPETDDSRRLYDQLSRDNGAQVIGGCIVNVDYDYTHPLFYGINRNHICVFKRGTDAYDLSKNKYATPMVYAENVLESGYMSQKNQDRLKNTAAVIISKNGRGRVINMADNYNFRAFWLGTNKIFMNAIFFGGIINLSAAD